MASTRKTSNPSTVVGVFEDRRHADQAVAELRKAGFRDDQIGLAMPHAEGHEAEGTGETGTRAGGGAVAGGLTGLGLGALAGLGVVSGVIPVVGPAIAAGTLGVILSNAAAGAGIAGLVGALVGAGMSEDEAHYYQGELEAGRTILTVHADGRADEARAIMQRHGGYDRAGRATTTGERVTAADAACATTGAGAAMEVREERLHAEKHPVEAGEIHLRKEVRTENKTIEVPVKHEEVVIERAPARGQASSGTIREGEEIRIPVREEQVDVHKDTVVKEEVRVGKRVVEDTERVSGQVRKEEVHLDREGHADVRECDPNQGRK